MQCYSRFGPQCLAASPRGQRAAKPGPEDAADTKGNGFEQTWGTLAIKRLTNHISPCHVALSRRSIRLRIAGQIAGPVTVALV